MCQQEPGKLWSPLSWLFDGLSSAFWNSEVTSSPAEIICISILSSILLHFLFGYHDKESDEVHVSRDSFART